MTHVLLVDDDDAILEIARHILKTKHNLEVDTSNSVDDALIQLSMHDYDAIVSDYAMPQYTGFDLLRIIREKGYTIPFILFTIKDREEMVVQALNLGVSFYVQKDAVPGVAFADLANKITLAVEHSRAEKVLRIQRDLAITCTSVKERDTIISACTRACIEITGMTSGAIYLNNATEKNLSLAYHIGFGKEYLAKEKQEGFIAAITRIMKDKVPVYGMGNKDRDGKNDLTLSDIKYAADIFYPIIHHDAPIGLVHLATVEEGYQIQSDITYHLESTIVQMASHIVEWQKEHALVESERKMSTLLGNLPGMAYSCSHDQKRTMHFVSDGCLPLTGYASDELTHSIAYGDLIHEKDRDRIMTIIDDAIARKSQFKLTYRIQSRSGKIHSVMEQGRGVYSPDGNLSSIEGFIFDNTKEKQLHDSLHISEKRLKLLFSHMNSGAAIFSVDERKRDLVLLDLNSSAEKMENKTRSELVGMSFFDIFTNPSAQSMREAGETIIEDGKPKFLPKIPFSSGNKTRWREAYLFRANSLHGKEVFLLYSDITDRIIYEQQTIASLREKELLLKEVHHRVKNNLQIISGILKLQLYAEGDQDITEIIQNCRNQVYSMASIHEKLYNASNIANINIKSYIEDLVDYLSQEYSGITTAIAFDVDCDPDIYLDIDTCIPCGLILNETITNAVKHAFPKNSKDKTIQIRFEQDNDSYIMKIADNGVGLDDVTRVQKKKSLGMELLWRLSRQLKGNVSIEGTGGTTITVSFPKKTRG